MERKATFSLAESDAVTAARAAYRRRLRQPRMMAVLLVLYAAIIAILSVLLGEEKLGSLLIAAAIAPPIALAIMGRVLAPALARANYRQTAGLKGETEMTWDEGGFVLEHRRGSLRLDWSELVAVHQAGDVLLLFQSDMIYNLVPLAAFSPEQRVDLQACAKIAA